MTMSTLQSGSLGIQSRQFPCRTVAPAKRIRFGDGSAAAFSTLLECASVSFLGCHRGLDSFTEDHDADAEVSALRWLHARSLMASRHQCVRSGYLSLARTDPGVSSQ